MKSLISFFLILSSLILAPISQAATPIGTLGAVPSVTVGGRVFTDLTNLIVLICYTTSANNYSTCRKPGASSGYAVTSGKTFTAAAVRLTSNATSTQINIGCALRYTDNDLGQASSSTGTNPVSEMVGSGSLYRGPIGGSATVYLEFSTLPFQVPATKYVGATCGGTGDQGVFLFGYET